MSTNKMIDHVDDFVLDNDWTQQTANWYKRRLTVWFAYASEQNLTMQTLTPGQFTRFLNQMRREGLSYSTRNGTYTAVANYSHWLKTNGYIQQNIFTGDNKPKRPRPERKVVQTVSVEYIQKMIARAESEPSLMNKRNACILRLLATTGMRRAEAAGLAIPDLDFEQQKITIRQSKYMHQRFAFMLTETALSLNNWLEVRPATEHDKVFLSIHTSKKGQYHELRPDAINKIIDRMKREAGIPDQVRITPHLLRHTFASMVVKSGNPFALKDLLGHSDIGTTEIYIHNDLSELRRVAKFGPKL